MKSTIICLGLSIAMISYSYTAKSQGCSDAGFCTLGSLKPNGSSMNSTNVFKFGTSAGIAYNDIFVYGVYIDYQRQINDKLSIAGKITSLGQTGNSISKVGLSDFFLTANYSVSKNITFTAGTKLPFTNGNANENNVPLPMDYQASLGTIDAIVGVGWNVKNWQLSAALQQPLTQNENQFIDGSFPKLDGKDFPTTNEYQRKGDALLRASYPIQRNKLTITPGLLSIYHLGNDKYTIGTSSPSEKEIMNSDGLTLNGTLFFDYQLSNTSMLQVNFGAPFIAREVRPDGLTRKFIVTIEYAMRF